MEDEKKKYPSEISMGYSYGMPSLVLLHRGKIGFVGGLRGLGT
jgi:hypothetical protein